MSTLHLAILVLALIASAGLAAANPTTDDYVLFIERELSRALDQMDASAPNQERDLIRSVFRAKGRNLVDGTIRPNTRRHNWGLWSWFDTKVLDVEVIVLGVGNYFIPIKGVEEMRLKVGRLAF